MIIKALTVPLPTLPRDGYRATVKPPEELQDPARQPEFGIQHREVLQFPQRHISPEAEPEFGLCAECNCDFTS